MKMNKTIELELVDALTLLSLAASVVENQPYIKIMKPKDWTDGQHLALVADLAVRTGNAKSVLAKLDKNVVIHPLLSLPRDGIRWSER